MKIAQTNLANIAGYPILANLQPKDKIIHKIKYETKYKNIFINFVPTKLPYFIL